MQSFQEKVNLTQAFRPAHFLKHKKSGFYCYQSLKTNLDPIKKIKCMDRGNKGRTATHHISRWAESRLAKFFSKFNQELYDLIGKTYEW